MTRITQAGKEEGDLELSVTEQAALVAYVEVARLEFNYAVSLTRSNPAHRDELRKGLDAALDILDQKRDAVDEDNRAVLDLLTAKENRC